MDTILIFTDKDLRIILIGTVVGGIVQYACWKYVKSNPELFENLDDVDDEFAKEIAKETSKTRKLFKRICPFLPRGGGAGEKLVELFLKKLAKRLANKGVKDVVGGLLAAVVVEKIPKRKAVSTILRYAATKLKDGSPITYTKWNELKYLSLPEMDPLSAFVPENCIPRVFLLTGLMLNISIISSS